MASSPSPASRSADPPDDDSVLAPDVPPEALAPVSAEGEPPADIEKLATVLGESGDVRTLALIGLLVLAVVYTLNLASALLLPIVLAILLDFLLSPLVRWLQRFRLSAPAAAALIMLTLLGGTAYTTYRLAAPAAVWIQRGPESLAHVQAKLRRLRRPVEQVTKAAEQVQSATDVGGSKAPQVQVVGPSLSSQIFGGTTNLLGGAMTVVFLTYFLLAAGDLFLQKVIKVLPQFRDKKRAVMIAREIEAQISVFMIVNTVISIAVGAVTALAVWAVGLPNPPLWGIVAALLNYVPYIGALVTMVLLGLAGFLTFESTARALALPAIFFVVNMIEGNLVTPMIMGKRLRLNTVAVFVGLIFWWYIWGIAGAIMAVPMLAILKIVCDHFETLAPVGEFLGE